jgi:hypothetical protein
MGEKLYCFAENDLEVRNIKKIFLEVLVFRKLFRDLRNTQNKLACNGTQKVLTNFVSTLLILAALLIIVRYRNVVMRKFISLEAKT